MAEPSRAEPSRTEPAAPRLAARALSPCQTERVPNVRRRQTALDVPRCNYAAVGATASHDLLAHPPRGFAVGEYRAQLGSGRERFEKSISRLMRFGVQRGAGLHVRNIEHQTRSLAGYRSVYHGDHEGGGETGVVHLYPHLFDANDELLMRPGTTADIVTTTGPFTFHSPVRVLTIVAEERMFGYAYGTLSGGPEAGEQRFLVSWEPDNTVWITIREIVRPGNPLIACVWPFANQYRKSVVRKYLAALHPATPQPLDA